MLNFAICVAIAAASPVILAVPWYFGVCIGAIIYIASGGSKYVYLTWIFVTRDIFMIFDVIKCEKCLKTLIKEDKIAGDLLAEHALKYPTKVAYWSADTNEKLTYNEANELANKVANYFYELGYRKGDVVALFMENRVEYVPIWIGLSKIGVITSFVNSNLKRSGLFHCISITNTKAIIYSSDLKIAVGEVLKDQGVDEYCYDDVNNDRKPSLKNLISLSKITEPQRQNLSMLDKVIYIYTSGTTGLPKAAIIKHYKIAKGGIALKFVCKMDHDDISYNTLPMYHFSGGGAMVYACLLNASTLVIRKKFSASHFFEDCCKFNCTVFNYVGEICRYLLAQPLRDFDKQHKIRFCTGNGLRGSIWKEFQSRFNIPIIKEFYTATEANGGLINLFGVTGAVGYLPPCLASFSPIKLIKMNKETESILSL